MDSYAAVQAEVIYGGCRMGTNQFQVEAPDPRHVQVLPLTCVCVCVFAGVVAIMRINPGPLSVGPQV